MKKQIFDHRSLIREDEITTMQIRKNGESYYDFFGSIDQAKKELMRMMKLDYKKAIETSQDLKELIIDIAKAKAEIRTRLSYNDHLGNCYDVYYRVDDLLIRDYLESVDCCDVIKTLIVDNLKIDESDGSITVDRDSIIQEANDNIDNYLINEEMLNYYIEEIQDAGGYHLLEYEDKNEEDGDYIANLLFSYLK